MVCEFINPRYSPVKNRRFAGVGSSSNSPESIIDLAIRFGKMACDLGIGTSSGDAVRMDRAFFAGARQSKNFNRVASSIYLAWNGVGLFDKSYHNPSQYYYDAQRFSAHYTQAQALAKEARGSFERLGKGGIALHTRNAFQIMGDNLVTYVDFVVFWAKPTGDGKRVAGGTNTAFQIATKLNIPTFNLYYSDVREAVEKLLEEHEATYGRADTRHDKPWIDPRQWGDVPEEKRIGDPGAGRTHEPQRSGDDQAYQKLKGLLYPQEG